VPLLVASRLHLLALVPVALLLVGCGERSEPVGVLPQPYPVTVRGGGDRTTTLEARPDRIVALDPGAAELVAALDGGKRLVGVPAGIRTAAKPDVVVSRTGQVDVDAVVRLKPDLVVTTSAVDQLDAAQAERRSKAALYVEPDSSVEDVLRGTIELGFLVGEPVKARVLAARLETQVSEVEAQVAAEPVVTVFVDTGFFITIPERSMLGDLIRRARGRSVAGGAPGPDPFPPERLRQLDPDVYLATSESRVTLAQLRADPRTAGLTAVRRKRFAVLPSELVLRPGPRLGRGLGRVAKALHPDAFR
jgi:iron complex transport system substrate-binding protein